MKTVTNKFEHMLSKIDLFKGLPVEVRHDISGYFRIDRFQQGEKLIQSGSKATRFYIIFNGNVELQTPNLLGHIKREVKLKECSTLGAIALLTNTPYTSDAVALEKTIVYYLDSKEFKLLLEKHKSFADNMSAVMSNRMAHDGGINKVGRYTLTRKIGEGNMAIVFEAHDPTLDRKVAIKMLKYDLSVNKDFLKRFEHEARVIAKLNHPNIVNVYEAVSAFSTHFIIMERLKGKDLDEILKHKGPLKIARAREILYQVACSLEYAHSIGAKGIIHRDIKPSNIFIDKQGNVKLMDFGIAKPPMDEVTMILGTPMYLAPEIIQGKPFDGRADIYSLGIMAFTMLTGDPPFVAPSLSEVLNLQVNQQPPDIKKYRPEIDNDLVDFIQQSLKKDPEERICDWKLIKTLLKPEVNREATPDHNDHISFITKIDGSYQQTALVINKLRKILEDENIDHSFEILKNKH